VGASHAGIGCADFFWGLAGSAMTNLLHELFDATAAQHPDNEALRYRGQGLSYAALEARSRALGAALRAAGVNRGDRVAVCMPNRPEVVQIALACSRIGAIFVPANPMLKIRQLEHLVRDAGAKLLVASQGAAFAPHELLQSCPSIELLLLCDTTEPLAADPRLRRFENFHDGPFEGEAGVIADDPAALLYTSGSTGRPKGVVVSHRNLVAGARSVSQYQKNVPGDRILAALPLSFDYGFSQVTTAFAVGGCAILTNSSLPAGLLQEVVAERVTGLAGVPTMWMQLAALEWPAAAVASLRYITNSGGALPAAVLNKLRATLSRTLIFCMYGLTEAFRSTYLDPAQLDRKTGSIGKAIPGQEILVLRPDGTECAPNEVGELVHRGSLVTLGYWNDRESTDKRFRPIAHRLAQMPRSEIAVWSGDLARTDDEGFLYFMGRADALIKSSGYRISPSEIEEIVAEVPGVVEAVAVGIPDESLGQRVVVAVVPRAEPNGDLVESVRQHCRVQLPAYLVPAEVHLLPALPRNVNGKFDRALLATMLTKLSSGKSRAA
jgi:acyl-CoA ligase (AMP-forming) (exosortase A-associated)